jgi:subtilisin
MVWNKRVFAVSALALLVVILSGLMVSPALGQQPERVKVLIGFTHQPGPDEEALVRGVGGSIKYTYHLVPAIAATLPEPAISGLLANPNVTRIEPDGEVWAIDEELDNAWGVKRIGAGVVHAYNTGAGVKVAVLDTGIDTDHPDLDYDPTCSESFVDGEPLEDGHSHGTHVAGTIAALDNDDNESVVGVAPEATLCIYKVLSDSGSGDYSDVIAALQQAVTEGVQVTNNSYGSSGDPGETLKAAFDNAYERGVLHVAAAGNSGNLPGKGDNCIYPARWDSLIATAATKQDDNRASFSSTCPEMELAAPGYQINSTVPGGYGEKSGTSMASPHVAGTAALVIATGITDSNNNGFINDEVRQRLIETADDLGAAGRDTQYGYGLVDADEAAPEPSEVHDVAVTGVTAPSWVVVGDLVSVDVTVENQSTFDETFSVTLTDMPPSEGTDGTINPSLQIVTLDAGGSTTVTFEWNTANASTGDHTLKAEAVLENDNNTADNSMTATVTVKEATHDVAVTSIDAPSSVAKGTTVSVDVTVENQGTFDENFDVTLTDMPPSGGTVGTISPSSQQVTLAAGDSITVPFEWDTTGASAGDHILTATAGPVTDETDQDDNSKSSVVTVEEEVTIRVQITSGGDDVNSSCVFRSDANEIYFGLDESCDPDELYSAGFRFINVQIPQGVNIISAHLEFIVDGPYNNDLSVKLWGEDTGNAESFSDSRWPSNLTKTFASVQWDITGNWKSGTLVRSPEITLVIQEIINREDWSQGNALIITGETITWEKKRTSHRRVFAYERNPGSAAWLIVKYGP